MSIEKRIKVLVVQKNRSIACKIKDFLDKMQGYEIVDFAFDGQSAIDFAMEDKPDVIIVDMLLPVIDGFGVIESIKKQKDFANTKIILTSPSPNDFILKKMAELQIDYFFIHPITFNIFSERLKEVVEIEYNIKANNYIINDDRRLEFKIKEYLRKIGMPANISGYTYLTSAILYTCSGIMVYGNLSQVIYPKVAKKYNTTPSRVERSIRHAIEVAWDRGNIEVFDNLFGYTISEQRGKPTNGEFIAMITDKVNTDLLKVE